jgi:hypothetical protein
VSESGDKVCARVQCCCGTDMRYGDGAHSTSSIMEAADVSGFFWGVGEWQGMGCCPYFDMGITDLAISPPNGRLITAGLLVSGCGTCRQGQVNRLVGHKDSIHTSRQGACEWELRPAAVECIEERRCN